MNIGFLGWLSAGVECLGLALIAIDLYLPRLPQAWRRGVDATMPQPLGGTPRQRENYRLTIWISLYAVVWIAVAGGLSAFDARLGVAANIALAVLTALVVLLFGLFRLLRLSGVSLGRGSSLGTLGLATALIGVAMHLSNLWLGI
ncbi:MAG: hypothetical protein AAGA68_23360 [Pseudomonadota bacterium]